MIEKRLKNSNIDELLKDVLFITLFAVIFFFVIAKFGGYVSDIITKSSCKAIDETYVAGTSPGGGVCVKSTDNVDTLK